jgi:hypothetical protein
LEEFAERTAAATVRGAGGAVAHEGSRWRQGMRDEQRLRRASHEVTVGALEALGPRLRRPLLAVAGAGSALVALVVMSARWRHA